MNGFSKLSAISAFAIAAGGLCTSPASAQATRTWVSGVGDDANPCSRTAPCKTFAGAISKTATGGEIDCLDPAGFGAVTITKSITIDCTGTLGGILASSTTGVIINGADAVVALRGLTINGGPSTIPGINGVRFLQGQSLTIEDSVIFNFAGASPNGYGVLFAPSGTSRLSINNTTIRDNGAGTTGGGVLIQPTGPSGSARVVISNSRIDNNSASAVRIDTTGATSDFGILVDIDHSRLAGSTSGVSMNTPASTTFARVNITGSTIVHNALSGFSVTGAAAVLRASGNLVTDNGFAILLSGGGQAYGYGDNVTDGNQNPSTFSVGSPLGKN